MSDELKLAAPIAAQLDPAQLNADGVPLAFLDWWEDWSKSTSLKHETPERIAMDGWLACLAAQRRAAQLDQTTERQKDEVDALTDLRKAVLGGADDEWLLGFIRGYPFTRRAAQLDANALPPLPPHIEVGGEGWGWEDFQSWKTFTVENMEKYALQAVAPYAERIRHLEREMAERKPVSIDTPVFRELLSRYNQGEITEAQFIADIDGRTAGTAWISVDDERKPEARKPVLLWVRTLTRGEDDEGRPHEIEGEEVAMGEYRRGISAEMSYFDCYTSPMSDNDWITHWMPLPAAPSLSGTEEGNGN